MEDTIQGKHFSITDPQGVSTVIYRVNKTEKEFLNEFRKLCYSRSSWQVWADLMAAIACSISNQMMKNN